MGLVNCNRGQTVYGAYNCCPLLGNHKQTPTSEPVYIRTTGTF
jgi:hypothetical protein